MDVNLNGKVVKSENLQPLEIKHLFDQYTTNKELGKWAQLFESLSDAQKEGFQELAQESAFQQWKAIEKVVLRKTEELQKAIASFCACVWLGVFRTDVLLRVLGLGHDLSKVTRGSALSKVCIAFGDRFGGLSFFDVVKGWKDQKIVPDTIYKGYLCMKETYIPLEKARVSKLIDANQVPEGMDKRDAEICRRDDANGGTRAGIIERYILSSMRPIQTEKELKDFVRDYPRPGKDTGGVTRDNEFKNLPETMKDSLLATARRCPEVVVEKMAEAYESAILAGATEDEFLARLASIAVELEEEMTDVATAEETPPVEEPVAEAS